MTLLEIAKQYNDNLLTDNEVMNEVSKITIYQPELKDKENPANNTWTIMNDNAWWDVQQKLVNTGDMSLTKYGDFYKLVSNM